MSDTPRTDAEAIRLDDWGDSMFYPDFARQLERELNQAIKERNEARECLREAIQFRNTELNGYDLDRWKMAAGLEDK